MSAARLRGDVGFAAKGGPSSLGRIGRPKRALAPRVPARQGNAPRFPGRCPERVSAEGKGGAAWTERLHPDAAAPADARSASAPRRGGRGRICRRSNPASGDAAADDHAGHFLYLLAGAAPAWGVAVAAFHCVNEHFVGKNGSKILICCRGLDACIIGKQGDNLCCWLLGGAQTFASVQLASRGLHTTVM